MMSKIIVISIFVTAYFISSVEPVADVIETEGDSDFLAKAKASNEEIVAVVFTNNNNHTMRDWMTTHFGKVVSKFFHVKIGLGVRNHKFTNRYFNNTDKSNNQIFPALYVMQNDLLLKDRLTGESPDPSKLQYMAFWAVQSKARKRSEELVTVGLEKLITEKKPLQGKKSSKSKSTRVKLPEAMERTESVGQKRGLNVDLNAISSEDNNNNNKRFESGGSYATPTFECQWGKIFDHTIGANTGLSSAIPSKPSAATGSSGSGRSSKSPSANPSGRGRWRL